MDLEISCFPAASAYFYGLPLLAKEEKTPAKSILYSVLYVCVFLHIQMLVNYSNY